MKAFVIRSHDEGASNGGGGEALFVVDLAGKRIYLKHSYSWYDQTGDEENSYAEDSFQIVSVDKEPFGETKLREEVEAFLKQFAANNFTGGTVLNIRHDSKGKVVDGVDGFTSLAKQEIPLNPVFDQRNPGVREQLSWLKCQPV